MSSKKRANEEAIDVAETAAEPELVDEHPKADEKPSTVEDWRDAKKTPAWLFAAAKTMHAWPEGRVMDERAYDEAIAAAGSVRIGGHANYPLPRRSSRRK